MSKKNKTVSATAENNGGNANKGKLGLQVKSQQLGLSLFGLSSVGPDSVLGQALVHERIQKDAEPVKDKNGKVKLTKSGKVAMRGPVDRTVFGIKPRTSKDAEPGDDLKTTFNASGQELMGFEAVALKEMSEAVIRELGGRIATGDIVITRGSVNNNTGRGSLGFKRTGIRVSRTITKEEALRALNLSEEDLQMVIEQHEKAVARDEKIAA